MVQFSCCKSLYIALVTMCSKPGSKKCLFGCKTNRRERLKSRGLRHLFDELSISHIIRQLRVLNAASKSRCSKLEWQQLEQTHAYMVYSDLDPEDTGSVSEKEMEFKSGMASSSVDSPFNPPWSKTRENNNVSDNEKGQPREGQNIHLFAKEQRSSRRRKTPTRNALHSQRVPLHIKVRNTHSRIEQSNSDDSDISTREQNRREKIIVGPEGLETPIQQSTTSKRSQKLVKEKLRDKSANLGNSDDIDVVNHGLQDATFNSER